MFNQLLAKSPAKRAGERLYRAAVEQGRQTAFYLRMGVPDSVEGRFELLTLHVILLIDRLKDAAAPAGDVRQTLFDTYVSNLDGALREMGVGDLAVGKRMRRLGEAFYGRARSFDAAFSDLPDLTSLAEVLHRTALRDVDFDPIPLAAYVADSRRTLRLGDLDSLVDGRPTWSAP